MVIKRLSADGGGGYSGISRVRMGGPSYSRGIFRRGGQWRTIDRRDIRYGSGNRPGISVGRGGVPVLKSRPGLPELSKQSPGTPTIARSPLFEPPIGQNQTQNQSNVQMVVVDNWFDWHKVKSEGGTVTLRREGVDYDIVWDGSTERKIAHETVPVPLVKPAIKTTAQGGSMDLGDLLGKGLDLYSQYQQIKYAQPTATPVQQPTIQTADFDWGVEPDIPFIDVVKKKRCRRRRRRLATKSDLGDLAALKAILGNGEAFKAWIATHSR